MDRIKIITLAILATCLSGIASFVSAGSYGCSMENVAIPCDSRAWHVVVEGLYIEPTNDDLSYYDELNDGPGSGTYIRHSVSTDHDWAWRLGGGYHFGPGNDISVDWAHFDHDYGHRTQSSEENNVYEGKAEFSFDIINFEFGQIYNLGSNGDLRLAYGFQYFKLDHHLLQTLHWNESSPSISGHKWPSEFHGFGPRVTLDWFYPLPNGFYLVSKAGATLLVGDLEYELLEYSSSQEGVLVPYLSQHKHRTVVPSLEGRVGLRYNKTVEAGVLTFEGGWLVAGHFQTVEHANINFGTHPFQMISNFGHHGPYINLRFTGKR